MKSTISFMLLYIALCLSGCTGNLCGELDDRYRKLLDSVQTKYGGVLTVESIPCENNYINVIINSDTINEVVLDSLHKLLYDKNTNLGWTTLDIYDAKKIYKYSHGIKGNVYVRKGD